MKYYRTSFPLRAKIQVVAAFSLLFSPFRRESTHLVRIDVALAVCSGYIAYIQKHVRAHA